MRASLPALLLLPSVCCSVGSSSAPGNSVVRVRVADMAVRVTLTCDFVAGAGGGRPVQISWLPRFPIPLRLGDCATTISRSTESLLKLVVVGGTLPRLLLVAQTPS